MKIIDSILAILIGLMLTESVLSDERIVIQFTARPPFIIEESSGSIIGLVGKPALEAFMYANIAYTLLETPPARQLARLKANTSPICSIGFYKTPERETFAKFTKPVSQDSPMVGLANPRLQVDPNATVDDVLQSPHINVLVKNDIAYGAFLDTKFKTMKAIRQPTSSDYDLIVKMIYRGRADIAFMPLEEVNYYIQVAGYSADDFNVIHFKDMPAGQKRYIVCSKSVDDSIIAKLNQFIR